MDHLSWEKSFLLLNFRVIINKCQFKSHLMSDSTDQTGSYSYQIHVILALDNIRVCMCARWILFTWEIQWL